MARDYSIVKHRFWTGETGRALRARGRDAQVLALYLVTCRSSNMTGLYYVPIATIAHETGVTPEESERAMRDVEAVGFCAYDWDASVVLVHEMARHQIGAALGADDNRRTHVLRQLEDHADSYLVRAFVDRYDHGYKLKEHIDLARVPELPSLTPSKGAQSSPSAEPEKEPDPADPPKAENGHSRDVSKPLRSQGSGIRDQGSGTSSPSAAEEHPGEFALKSDEKPRGRLPFKREDALLELARVSAGRFVYSKPSGEYMMALAPLVRDHPELHLWRLTGEYLAAGNEKGLDVLGVGQLIRFFRDLCAKAQAWDERGRKALDIAKAQAKDPRRGICVDDA